MEPGFFSLHTGIVLIHMYLRCKSYRGLNKGTNADPEHGKYNVTTSTTSHNKHDVFTGLVCFQTTLHHVAYAIRCSYNRNDVR